MRAASKFLTELSLNQKWHFSISIHYFIRSICLKIPFQTKTQSPMCQRNPFLKNLKFKYLKLKNVDLKLLTLKSCLNVLCLSSTCGPSCVTAMVAAGIQFEQCFFLRDDIDNDHGKCTLTRKLLSRADPTHEPYLKLMKCFTWNFIFHNKKVQAYYFFFFYKKANVFQKNKLFSVYSSFFPLKEFWIIQCLMLIFGMNQCRCSWKKPLLRITSSATKVKNLKPELRKKLFCTFSICHFLNSCQVLCCWWHFQPVCQNKCRVCHVLLVHKALSNSDHLQPFYLVSLRRSFEINFVVLHGQKYEQFTLWHIKIVLGNILIWIKHSWRKTSILFSYKYCYFWHLLVTTVAECNLNTNKNPLY